MGKVAELYWLIGQRHARRNELKLSGAAWENALVAYQRVLRFDPEHVAAHWGLSQVYAQLGDTERAQQHRALHQRFKPDETAVQQAVAKAIGRSVAAGKSASPFVIYQLRQPM